MQIANEIETLTNEYNAIQKRSEARWMNDEPKNETDIERARFLDAEIRRLDAALAVIREQEGLSQPII